MSQPGPRYPKMAIAPMGPIYSAITKKYGGQSVCWPLMAYDLQEQTIEFLMLEVNALNKINQHISGPFLGPKPYPEYKLDYLSKPRVDLPVPLGHNLPWPGPKDIMDSSFSNSYEYVTIKRGMNTIDVDYIWRTNHGLKGLEVSTFYNEMTDKRYAEHLVREFIEKRAARKGAHQFALQAKIAAETEIDLSLVFANTIGHTLDLRTDGKVYSIHIDPSTAQALHAGNFVQGEFLDFNSWLTQL